MKSLLTKIISVLTIIVLCVSLCACDETTANNENCLDSHSFILTSYTAPTCKTIGAEVYQCSRCGYVETKTLLQVDHDYALKSTASSTCTVHGSKIYECSMCHEMKTYTLPLKDHDYELVSEIPSSCTVKGSQTFECKDCTESYTNKLDLLKHDYRPFEIIATCFNGGSIGERCQICNDEIISVSSPELKHEFKNGEYCSMCGVHKMLFDYGCLMDCKYYFTADGFAIEGNLVPIFNNNSLIPIEYWETHTVTVTISIINNFGIIEKSYDFHSQTIGKNSPHAGKLTIQNFSDGFIDDNYADAFYIKVNSTSYRFYGDIFSVRFQCDGYEAIEWREAFRY